MQIDIVTMKSLALALLAAAVSAQPFPPTPQMERDAAAIIAAATVGGGNTTAWDRLAEATDTFGGRLSGSAPLNSFIQWVAAKAATDLNDIAEAPCSVWWLQHSKRRAA